MKKKEKQNVIGTGVFKSQEFTLGSGKTVSSAFPVSTYILLFILLLSTLAVVVTRVNIPLVIRNGLNFWDIPIRMFPIDWEYFAKASGPMVDTIQMSLLGSIVGSALALPVAFLAASNINKNKPSLLLTRMILTLFRTLPVLVYAAIFTVIFGFGTFAGTLAIMLFTFSIVSKILYENVETIDLGAFEAIESTGSNKLKAIVVAILPQVLPSFISTALYSFEINIRYAAILGYVGAGGIGLLMAEKLGWKQYNEFGLIFVLLFVVVVSIESLSKYLRGRLE